MFLEKLKNTQQKEAFLQLAMICAKSNGVIDEVEQEILGQYCDEMKMQMPKNQLRHEAIVEDFECEKTAYTKAIDEIISVFSGAQILKIVYFELIALIWADEVVTPIEADILSRLQKQCNEDLTALGGCALGLVKNLNLVTTIEMLNQKTKGE